MTKLLSSNTVKKNVFILWLLILHSIGCCEGNLGGSAHMFKKRHSLDVMLF